MTHTNSQTARETLVRAAARCRVTDLELRRAIVRAADGGMSQRQISAIVGTQSQATIHRILQHFSGNRSLLEETPAEVIDKRTAGLLGDSEMMTRLANWDYTFGRVACVDGVATDGYIGGSWDDIELAYYCNLLSDDEFARLVERNKSRLEGSAHITTSGRQKQR